MKIFFSTVILFLSLFPILAQSADSLEVALLNAEGEEKLKLYLNIIRNKDDPGEAIDLSIEYLEESKLQHNNIHQSHALNNLGINHFSLGFYETTLDFFFQIIELEEVHGGPKEIARIWNNIAIVYQELDMFEKATEAFNNSLKLRADKSLAFDSSGTATTHGNLSELNFKLKDYEKSLYHSGKAYQIFKNLKGEELGVFIAYNNFALNYLGTGQLDSAQFYLNKAFEMNEAKSFGSFRTAELHRNMAELKIALNNYEEAQQHYETALAIGEALSARQKIMESHEGLSHLYARQGDFEKAYEHHMEYMTFSDSIFNDKNAKRMAEIESDYHRKRQLIQIDDLQQRQEMSKLRLNQNQAMMFYLGCGLVLLLIVTIVLIQQNKLKNSNNKLLEASNKEIAEKNENITNSILYAKGIQEAILPDRTLLDKIFTEAFVMYKARDIVNGDFYWFADMDEHFIMAVVDCTGHGVPGAFMNVLGNSLLNQIVHEQYIIQPGRILEALDAKILKTMQSEHYEASNDGMDIAIVQYRKTDHQIVFSGAKRPMYYIASGVLKSIKGNNFSLGGHYIKAGKQFDDHTVQLKQGDSFYLFTDGMVDQFGGEHDSKYMTHRLKTLLENIDDMGMHKQLAAINKVSTDWRGKSEQTDDILIIGARV